MSVPSPKPNPHPSSPESDPRVLFNSGFHGMVLIGPDGSLMDFNLNSQKMLGALLGTAFETGRPFRDFVPADLQADYDEKIRRAFQGETLRVEKPVRTASGSEVWIEFTYNPVLDAEGKVATVCMTAVPVDERHRALEALRESEERYRRLVEFSPESVMVHAGGKILFANLACLGELGAASTDQLLGRPILDFIHPDYRELTLSRVTRIQEKGEANEWVEQRMLNLKGEVLEVETKGTPIQFQGRPAVMTLIRDIRDRKRNQAMLLRYERLAAVGQVITAIAHEIRGPLSVVGATAESLRAKAEERSEWREEADRIHAQTERLRRFFDDILDYSKEMSIQKERVSPREVMEQALHLARNQSPLHSGVAVLWDWNAVLPLLTADGHRLEQILVNLILNSFQALRGKGTIILSARGAPGWNLMEVRDDGLGIPEGVFPRLFEPFFTTKKSGTGLGLPISQKIAEAHGGRVEVRNLSPQGASCTLFLPAGDP